jgi:hypothetical protein
MLIVTDQPARLVLGSQAVYAIQIPFAARMCCTRSKHLGDDLRASGLHMARILI